jgi:hypothetical protein
MWVLLIAASIVLGLWFMVMSCVDTANAKETTTLDDALNRPVKVEHRYDKTTGVACFWTDRYPRYLSCVQVHPIGLAQERRLRNESGD